MRRERVFDPHEPARVEALAGLPLAEFWQRAAAFLIDFIIVMAVYIPFEIARQYFVQKYTHREIRIGLRLSDLRFSLHELEDLAFLVLYSGIYVWRTNGFTAGKRLLGIRVVSLTHRKISLWQSVERALGYGASALEAGFGFMQFFIHRNRCCVHDRIAETIVIKDRAQEQPPTHA